MKKRVRVWQRVSSVYFLPFYLVLTFLVTTNENMNHQPVLTSNTSAVHMPPSPHTQNMETTSNPELLNVGQAPNEEVKDVIEPEVSFPKGEDVIDDATDSDSEMKVQIDYDPEGR